MEARAILAAFIGVTLIQYVGCQEIDYSGSPYADYKVYTLGGSVDLHCNNTSQQSSLRPNGTIAPVSWMLNLPGLEIIYQSQGKYQISEDNWTLTIQNTTHNDFGQYHCMLLNPDDQWYLITVGLNVQGPYFEDLWKKYDMPVIIAFSALGGFLLITGILVLLYVFRYQSDEENNSDSSSDSQSSSSSGSSLAPVTVLGVKSVPGYTPYNTEDGDVIPTKPMEDSDSSNTSAHSIKVQENGVVLGSSEVSDKLNATSHSSETLELQSVGKVGKENKAFEAEPEYEKNKDKEITQADVHSSDSSSVASSREDGNEFTTM